VSRNQKPDSALLEPLWKSLWLTFWWKGKAFRRGGYELELGDRKLKDQEIWDYINSLGSVKK